MQPEDINKAIEELLENNQNGTKVYKRRRNKYKDMVKKARRMEPIIYDKIKDELLIYNKERPISYFILDYERDDLMIGMYDGWYDEISKISEEFDVPKSELRLEKLDYWADGVHYWDGDSLVYRQAYNMITHFYDENDKLITTRGIWSKDCHVSSPPEPAGEYTYDKNAVKFLDEYYGDSSPSNSTLHWNQKRIRINIGYDELLFRKLDTEHKYNNYAKAMREYGYSNFYKKTYPITKGNENGYKAKLIQAMNSNARNNKSLLEGIDDIIQDYETSAGKEIYEYYW